MIIVTVHFLTIVSYSVVQEAHLFVLRFFEQAAASRESVSSIQILRLGCGHDWEHRQENSSYLHFHRGAPLLAQLPVTSLKAYVRRCFGYDTIVYS